MIKRLIIIMFFNLFWSCNSSSQEFVIYSKNEITPVIHTKNRKSNYEIIEKFRNTFEQKTGYKLEVSDKIPSKKDVVIEILFTNEIKDGFELVQQKNKLIIKASDDEEMNFAFNHFFSEYITNKDSEKISIPKNLHYLNIADFEYREPYFPENFNKEFREKNHTHTIEENWGLWGHNIGKVIKRTNGMMAVVDGEINEEQFCFSSSELEQALVDFIKKQSLENPKASKFMIMPDDNTIVCQCEKCKKVGNTKTNASPAVFSFLDRIALKFPKKEFFGTAYISTKNPPSKSVSSNVGVMLSTMDFPKGIVIENSPKKESITKTINGWKQISDKLYLWDYVINFDNYFESYPTISITQENLRFYKKQGIKGVFLHGNEHDYSIFEDLKCHIYAKLLRNVNLDVKKETKSFFENKYPLTGRILYEYYNKIEQLSFQSPRQLDIYGGWNQAKKKYLNSTDFSVFYNDFSKKIVNSDKEEYSSAIPLFLSLTFQRLEIARTEEIGENGYAFLENGEAKIKPEIIECVNRLKQLFNDSEIEKYNEQGFLLKEYIKLWDIEILTKTHTNFLYGKKVKALSELDEDYPNTKMLTDGAIGFNDYYNNWLLCTTSKEVIFEVNANDVRKAKEIHISFLNDPRHRIYLPESVTVTIGDKIYTTEKIGEKEILKYEVSIPIEIEEDDKSILININKKEKFNTKSIACDEIIFR